MLIKEQHRNWQAKAEQRSNAAAPAAVSAGGRAPAEGAGFSRAPAAEHPATRSVRIDGPDGRARGFTRSGSCSGSEMEIWQKRQRSAVQKWFILHFTKNTPQQRANEQNILFIFHTNASLSFSYKKWIVSGFFKVFSCLLLFPACSEPTADIQCFHLNRHSLKYGWVSAPDFVCHLAVPDCYTSSWNISHSFPATTDYSVLRKI